MNIQLNLKIPLINSNSINITGEFLLYPFYCIESDVLNPFEEFDKNQNKFVRQIIHNNSIKVLEKTRIIEQLGILTEEQLNRFRRDFTICLSTLEVTTKLKLDYIGTITRMKKLGDFEVQTSKKTEGDVLNKLLDTTEDCVKEAELFIKQIESERVLPVSFAKGSTNPDNTLILGRIWWLSEFNPKIRDAFANNKIPYGNNRYKAGYFTIKENRDYVSEARADIIE